MNDARLRRFPPVSGPYGWAGAALTLAAVGCQGVAIIALVWLAFSNDSSLAVPWIVVLLASFPLGAGGVALWRIGWRRAGTLPPNSVPKERLKELLAASALMYLALALGFGGFVYRRSRLR
ncbi:MAG TPA: hypothetical protein VGR77_00780 [Candidatus Dormibacteraeota bacterium]|nr:hypothetical protein [Candidatus Dormibacteraeota bacterium]